MSLKKFAFNERMHCTDDIETVYYSGLTDMAISIEDVICYAFMHLVRNCHPNVWESILKRRPFTHKFSPRVVRKDAPNSIRNYSWQSARRKSIKNGRTSRECGKGRIDDMELELDE